MRFERARSANPALLIAEAPDVACRGRTAGHQPRVPAAELVEAEPVGARRVGDGLAGSSKVGGDPGGRGVGAGAVVLGKDQLDERGGDPFDVARRDPFGTQQQPGERGVVVGQVLGAVGDTELGGPAAGRGSAVQGQVALGEQLRDEGADAAAPPDDGDLRTGELHAAPLSSPLGD